MSFRVSASSQLVLAAVVVALVALTVATESSTPKSSPSALGASAVAQSSISITSPGSRAETEAAASIATEAQTAPAASALVQCRTSDQVNYVYNPGRLEVGAGCIYVTGSVDAVRKEADGDLHILLHLDAAYTHLLRPANQGEELGDLVVEPVCVRTVTQLDAQATCAADPDPLMPPFPLVGERVWMEGQYVFDLDHGGWAELHPLYRWGDT